MPTLVGGLVTVGASAGRAHGEDGRGTSSSPLPRLPPPLPFSSSFLSSSFFLFLLFFPSPFLPFPFLSFSSFFFLLLPSSSYYCFLLLLPSRRQEQGRTGPVRAGEDSRARRRWQHARTAAAGSADGGGAAGLGGTRGWGRAVVGARRRGCAGEPHGWAVRRG